MLSLQAPITTSLLLPQLSVLLCFVEGVLGGDRMTSSWVLGAGMLVSVIVVDAAAAIGAGLAAAAIMIVVVFVAIVLAFIVAAAAVTMAVAVSVVVVVAPVIFAATIVGTVNLVPRLPQV